MAQGEAAFLNEGGVTVTKTRFMVHAQTYALANITSVSAARIPAKRGGFVVCALLGLLVIGAALVAMLMGDRDDLAPGLSVLIIGLIFVGVGILLFKGAKDSYVVVLNTAGSETKALSSRDSGFISRVVAALNEAIVARG